MANYEFTRLADVATVETVSDTANVLIEEGAEIKKVAKNSIGAQANWNENDETSPAYVKNRTHWVEKELDIQWDGSTEGRVTVDMSVMATGALLVQISEKVLTKDEVIGATATFVQEQVSGTLVITESEVEIAEDGSGSLLIGNTVPIGVVASEDECTINELTFPKKGVYLFYIPDMLTVHSVIKETVHQLDAKFIPGDVGGTKRPVVFTVSSGSKEYLMVGGNYATAEEVVDAYFNGVGYVKDSQTPEKIIGFCASGDPYVDSSSNKGVVALTHMGASYPALHKYLLYSWDGYSAAIDKWLS